MRPCLPITSALLISLATGLCACEGDPMADPAPEMQAPAPDAEPEPEPRLDLGVDRCPERGRAGDPCPVEGARCAYPKNECECGDPHIYFACQDGALAYDGEEFECEYPPEVCEPGGGDPDMGLDPDGGAEPDMGADPDDGLEPDGALDPDPEPCPETASDGDPCATEDLRCSYPKNQCPCGDPEYEYVCIDGAFVDDTRSFGCEYLADACNADACDVGPGGACDADDLDCWFDDGLDEDQQVTRYRRWHCTDGALVATDETHISLP